MEAEYDEYKDEHTRWNERRRRDPVALPHASSEASKDLGALERHCARAIEIGIRYGWRDNSGRRAPIERAYVEEQCTKARDLNGYRAWRLFRPEAFSCIICSVAAESMGSAH